MTAGVYEAWRVPGGEEVMEPITASEAKPIGAVILLANAYRKFRIWWSENSVAYDRGCWVLEERWPRGTREAIDDWEKVDEFRALQEAKAVARRMLRSSRIPGTRGRR